ncbi:toxin [Streptomyces sp. WM6372]|nr:toxin [Streptomyces sp. WM6372]
MQWFKSSYSGSEGDDCIEVALSWHKSTYSGSEGDSCVEVAACADAVHIRDSKLTASPELAVHPATWTAFLGGVTGA